MENDRWLIKIISIRRSMNGEFELAFNKRFKYRLRKKYKGYGQP